MGKNLNWLRKKLYNTPRNLLQGRLDGFMSGVTGLIHVGANIGQERQRYATLGLDVVWVEPIPEVFATLSRNIADLPKQRALKYLLSDADGTEVLFNITSNNGESSSLLPLARHEDMRPDITVSRQLPLVTSTFQSMVQREGLDLSRYQALVLDTQGSELMVLRGMGEQVRAFRFIKTEATDFEAYKGCCLRQDLLAFLQAKGFRLKGQRLAARRTGIGSYYDMVLERA